AHDRTSPPRRIPAHPANTAQSLLRAALPLPHNPPALPPRENPFPPHSHSPRTISAPHSPYTTGHSRFASASHAAPALQPPTPATRLPPRSSARVPAAKCQWKPAARLP